jgi:subfamily B ATP-binding cassette protein MsbA
MFELIRTYLPEYRHYRGKLTLAFVAMFLVAGSTAAIAWMMKPLLDEIFINKNMGMLSVLPVLIIVAYVFKGGGAFVQEYAMSFVGQDIVRRVRDRLLNHLLHSDLAFFHRHHSGELISRITNDIGRIQGAVSGNLATLVRESLTAAALIGVVIYQSPVLSFFTLVVIPASFVPVRLISQRLKRISHTAQGRNAELTANLSEMFSNVEAIKAYHTEDFETGRFSRANKACFDINMKSVRTGGLVIPVMELFAAFSAAAVIYVGGRQVIDGSLTVGAFFSFLTAMFMAVDPIRRLSQTVAQLQDAVAAHERIQAMLALKPEVKSGDATLTTANTIALRHAGLRYGNKNALSDISLTARKGEIIALVGGSGGGKSSIASLLLRFFDATSGEVEVNGDDIRGFSLQSVRARMAIVTQRVHIFNDSIAANVAYGSEIDRARVQAALEKANIWVHVAALPDGMDTQLNEAGTNLSGGQRQRIAIARALYRKPEALILDEATSALDNASEAAILDTVRALAPDVITLIIAHRLRSVEMADRIYLIQHGKVICAGSRAELMRDCEAFRELYQ